MLKGSSDVLFSSYATWCWARASAFLGQSQRGAAGSSLTLWPDCFLHRIAYRHKRLCIALPYACVWTTQELLITKAHGNGA